MKTTLLAMGLGTLLALPAVAAPPKGPQYAATGHYYETCGCTVSCPCATNQFNPTEGHCDALMLFDFDKASVGKTKFDGIRLAMVMKSPKNRKVMEAFEKGELDHWAVYFDEKMNDEQKKALPQLLEGLFGKMEIKNAKEPAFVPISLSSEGDVTKIDVGGKATTEIENIKIGETKHGTKTEAKRIKLEGAVPFPWMTAVTQGKSHVFKYADGATKWEYKDRNAFFGAFNTKGTVGAAAPAAK